MASDTTVNNTNAEVFIIAWLDADVNTTESNKKAQQQLLTIISHLKTFEEKTECEKYIRSLSSQERLSLIVSGRLGKELVPDIYTLPQATSIYVYCQDKEKNEQWANRFKKVNAVITQLDQLISRIKIDQTNVLSLDEKQVPSFFVVVGGTEQLKTYCTPQFAYSQLLSNVLLQMKPNETDANDSILLCKNNNKDFETKLKIIDEFQQNYSSNKALRWFSSCSVIYKVLDGALKTQDINTIFLFRYFINDLHQQISKYQCKEFMKVYRSQLVSDDEINRLQGSLGSFISINMFFSTTLDVNIAFQLLQECGHSNDYHRVLFRINADPQVMRTKPFADISKQSGFPEQREVLFAIGSIFRITNIQQNDDQIWIVLMTLCGDDDPGLISCSEDMEKRYGYSSEEATLFSFSQALRAMKKFDEAEKYCHRLLQQFFMDDSSLYVVYDELAEIASTKGDYNLSNQYQQKSIKIKKKIEPDRCDNVVEAVSYNGKFSHYLSLSICNYFFSDDSKSPKVPDINNSASEDAALHLETKDSLRFTDVLPEKHEILLPIEGHEKMPLVSLEEAVIPLLSILPDIRRKVHTVKLKMCESC